MTILILISCKSEAVSVECAASDAGWSSLVARWAHNPKVVGSNPAPATNSFEVTLLVISIRHAIMP